QDVAVVEVPHRCRAALEAGGQAPAIAAERQGGAATGGPIDLAPQPARGHLPQPDVGARGREQLLPRRGEGQPHDKLAGGRAPDWVQASVPSAVCHTRTVWSAHAAASQRPSGLKAMAVTATGAVPGRQSRCRAVSSSTSQTRTVPSPPPVATTPSGPNATRLT